MKRNCSRGICGFASLVLTASVILQFSGCGDDGVWTPPPSAELAGLTISTGTLSPGFSSSDTFYVVDSVAATTMTVTPTALDSGATITVNGEAVASGATSSAIDLVLGTNTITVIVTATDGVTQEGYTLLVSAGGQRAYLKASNTEIGDYFGVSIAIDGDTVVVGADYEDSIATGVDGDDADNTAANSGAAYVFTRTGGVWTQQAYLKASNTDLGDYFGSSVAVNADTIVVGAVYEDSIATGVDGDDADNTANSSGAAYVFTRTGGVWTQQAYLKASNTDPDDHFGYSVAIDGDTVVVGSYWENSNATGVDGDDADNTANCGGAAYVFTRTGSTWSQQAYLKASNTWANDYFGCSVAVGGDTVVVGAYGEDSIATGVNGDDSIDGIGNSGAAYVFTRTGGVWSQQAYLKASNTGFTDFFGHSVAVDGDTVIVAAKNEASNATGVDGNQTDDSAEFSGAVYVFTRTVDVWSQQAYLKASNTETVDYFGYSIAISGDRIVVGAYGEDSIATGLRGVQADNSANASGAAYFFARVGSTWSQQVYLKASNTDAGDTFGTSVAADGDTIVVAARRETSNATGVDGDQDDNSTMNAGAVYVFE